MRKRSLKIYITLLTLFWFANIAHFCYADGGFFKSYDSYDADIREPSQKGVIIYENGVETLILQANFIGEVQDFAWVVPAPSLPELSKANWNIFEELHYFTEPEIRHRESFGCFGLFEDGGDEGDNDSDSGVTVIGTQTVGIYDTTTLSATDPRALTDWLEENGYHLPSQGEEIVKYYVDRGWYFVAMKIRRAVDPRYMWYEGGIQPISLKFSSHKMVYPMKITAVSSTDTELLLYIFAQSKMTFKYAELEYAGWIEAPEPYHYLSKLIEKKMYLTKLRAHIYQRYMDDIYPVKTRDNKAYRKVIYVKGPADGIDICLVACIALLLAIRKRELKG